MLRTFVLFIMTRLAALVPAIPGAGRIVAGLCAGLTCLASTADLKISIQTPPWDQSQPLWRRVTYTIIVSNAGPDTATQVVVTNQVVRMERESRSALASRRIAEHEHGYFLRCLPGRESQRATCAHVILTGHRCAITGRKGDFNTPLCSIAAPHFQSRHAGIFPNDGSGPSNGDTYEASLAMNCRL